MTGFHDDWSASANVMASRTCGCNEAAQAAGDKPDWYECDECKPALDAALQQDRAVRPDLGAPDPTDPGYWLDNR